MELVVDEDEDEDEMMEEEEEDDVDDVFDDDVDGTISDEEVRIEDVEDFDVDVEVDEVVFDAAGVELGRIGIFSPAAKLTYVLSRQPAPQYSVLLPAQVMLQSESEATSPEMVLPVKHWLAYSTPKYF